MHSPDRLQRQIAFILETEKLKAILRRTSPVSMSRRENSAEHSWTLAIMAMVLAEHSNEPLDVLRVLKMLLIHDLVEIDAGDTFYYDTAANLTKADREQRAAQRIFGLLPEPQSAEFQALWVEFEAGLSADARFANTLDRLMPTLQNLHNNGGSWIEYSVTREQVLARNQHLGGNASAALGTYAQSILTQAAQRNLFFHPAPAARPAPPRPGPLPALMIRTLDPGDAAAYQALRLEGLLESPAAFGASYSAESGRTPEEIAKRLTTTPEAPVTVWGAFAEERLIGLLALICSPAQKLAHNATLGGMYVTPQFRRRGVGGALLDVIIAHARTLPSLRNLKLWVSASNPAAIALYRSKGFVRFGVERESLCVDGIYYDEEFHALSLIQVS